MRNRLVPRAAVVAACLLHMGTARGAAAGAADGFEPDRFDRTVVVSSCHDGMQMEILADGRILVAERAGAVKLADPARGTVATVGTVPVALGREGGLVGLAADHGFAEHGWIYLAYFPASDPARLRVSRFTVRDAALDAASERVLLEVPYDADAANHLGGGLALDRDGNLLVGTGDNCPPAPELPVDMRPEGAFADALRTSADTQDLRGKVLRIRPEPDGSVSIPRGNLFPNAADGRPEIFAMGVRNAFRVTVDDDGTVAWGDIGPNLNPKHGVGPDGYDEFNRTRTPGNFGWPMFTGPNEPYRRFDFQARRAGEPFDPAAPENESPRNRGLRTLPPPRPALVWYPSGASREWPDLGSGGRSAIAGPVYHAARHASAPDRLPDAFDGRMFCADWMRNWVATITPAAAGGPPRVERFLPGTAFKKPIDLEIGPDGCLYVLEMGDLWDGNRDSRITRVGYRRGNRRPQARLAASPTAGRGPLETSLDAGGSTDPDAGDELRYAWTLDGRPLDATGSRTMLSLDGPATHVVAVTVRDRAGEADTASVEVRVGNEPPRVSIVKPADGSFYDAGAPVDYAVDVFDVEDGSTAEGGIVDGRVVVSRQPPPADDAALPPGLAAMRRTTCFGCHALRTASAGPAYLDIARRYAGRDGAGDRLATRIIQGGVGTWGTKAMPPHPQHSLAETRLMADWILALADDEADATVAGSRGFFRFPDAVAGGGVDLVAEYTDAGAPGGSGALQARGEARIRLHARRKPAAGANLRSGAEIVDVYEKRVGQVVRFRSGDWIRFDRLRLAGIDRIAFFAAAGGDGARLVLRLDDPAGPEIARIEPPAPPAPGREVFASGQVPIAVPGDTAAARDLYVFAERGDGLSGQPVASLAWLEFRESPAALERRVAEEARVKTIVLVPTVLDHPPGTHLYTDVCRLLAACLRQTPGVRAVVSPTLDFPADEPLLEEADALVWYSRPAGHIVLSPRHAETTRRLLARGVGFTAIHYATGAKEHVGEAYLGILGGWFNFAFAGVTFDELPLRQERPDHPVSRGWRPWTLRDEFYLDLRFSPAAEPIVSVDVAGTKQVVGWVLEREGGGRSFGTTLGHYYDVWKIPAFRRFVCNGILWTAGLDVPAAGAPVDVEPAPLEPDAAARPVVKAWTTDDLLPAFERVTGGRSFARGERLFQTAACAGCHRLGPQGGGLGPELTKLAERLASEADPRRRLLESIVEPSRQIADVHRMTVLQLADGRVLSGLVVERDDDALVLATDPARADHRERVSRADVESETPSPVSPMPAGLLDRFDEEEILDLLAYLVASGNPNHPLFARGQPAAGR
jgi:cytochrome c